MTEYPSKRKPLTPVEQLANLCDALWEDELLDTEVEIDEKRVEEARSVVQAAATAALGPPPVGLPSQTPSATDTLPKPPPLYQEPQFSKRYPLPRLSPLPQPPPQEERDLTKIFGLHPAIAMSLVAVNLIISFFTGTTVAGGFLLDIPVVPIAGFMTYMVQWRLFGDSRKAALAKALIAMVLTAIPFLVTVLPFIPAGILGFIRLRRRKTAETLVGTEKR